MNDRARLIAVQSGLIIIFWISVIGVAKSALINTHEMMETESLIIKLDADLQRAMVANSELASVQVINKRELLVNGHKAGRTDLILWYRNNPEQDQRITLKITPDQSRKEEITQAIEGLLSQLNPQGGVIFELKPVWINPESSVRREIDEVGNQIDGDANSNSNPRQDKGVLQESQRAGQLNVKPTAGNYMVVLSGEVANHAQKKRIHSVISALGLSVVNMINVTGSRQIKLSVRVAELTKGNPFWSGCAIRA